VLESTVLKLGEKSVTREREYGERAQRPTADFSTLRRPGEAAPARPD
jgi:hypothetical protein